MTTVFAAFEFAASHFLPNVPDGHKCRRMHGHNWAVEIYCKDKLGITSGWVIDFFEIERAWASIHEIIDHQTLNDVEGLSNPTSEVLARWIWEKLYGVLRGLERVVVKETANFGAIYEGGE